MKDNTYIELTKAFVKKTLAKAESGHDWFHTERVYKNALLIAEGEQVDLLVVGLGALLHDIADSKFHHGDEGIGPRVGREFMESINIPSTTVDKVVDIIENISFKNSLGRDGVAETSLELKVVQDADRLDAIGAIGIARAFNYGGYKNRPLYDPDIGPNLHMSKEEYKKSANPTINHFYEKLLLLKDQMNTETAKKMAGSRHDFMLNFLDHFYQEWDPD